MDGSMMRRGTCGNCDAYHEVGQRESGVVWGQCRDEPPRTYRENVPIKDEDGNRIGSRSSYGSKYPMVKSSWWCRKWGPAVNVEWFIEAVRNGKISINQARAALYKEAAEPVPAPTSTKSYPLQPHDSPRLIYRTQTPKFEIMSVLDDETPLAFQGDVDDLRLGVTKPGHYRTNKALGQVQLGSAPCGRMFVVHPDQSN